MLSIFVGSATVVGKVKGSAVRDVRERRRRACRRRRRAVGPNRAVSRRIRRSNGRTSGVVDKSTDDAASNTTFGCASLADAGRRPSVFRRASTSTRAPSNSTTQMRHAFTRCSVWKQSVGLDADLTHAASRVVPSGTRPASRRSSMRWRPRRPAPRLVGRVRGTLKLNERLRGGGQRTTPLPSRQSVAGSDQVLIRISPGPQHQLGGSPIRSPNTPSARGRKWRRPSLPGRLHQQGDLSSYASGRLSAAIRQAL